ncbi:MAG TPA: heavy metal transport/detoxification protein [Hanamia sp.]
MKKEQFKTNIMCGSCITKVTPVLNEKFGEGNWNVDTKNPKKILTVSTNEGNVNNVINVLDKVGYKAESLN